MFQVELKANLKAKEDLEKLTVAIRKDVIENGLDKALTEDLEKLKASLKYIVNEGIRRDTDVQEQMDPRELKISIPRSDEEIIKHLTGLDLTKFMKTKDFSNLTDAGVVMAFDRKRHGYKVDEFTGHPMSSGVNVRMPMSALDTFEAQYNMAVNYFNSSLFIFEENGKLTYYLNPGINMTQYVKVVCSNQSGDNQRSRDKFEQHRLRRGFADWTMLAEGLEVVKSKFINLNDVIDRIKEGDFSEAENIMRNNGLRTHKATDLLDRMDNLTKKKKLDPSTEAYVNIVNLIKNLKISKRITKEKVTYTLVSSYNETDEDPGDFFKKMDSAISYWKISNHRKWFTALVQEAEKVIKRIAV